MAVTLSEREAALSELLAEAFDNDADGLRRWVRLQLGEVIHRELPTSVSLTMLVFEVMLAARRHRLIDEMFFLRLGRERPGLGARIREVARLWHAANPPVHTTAAYRCMVTPPEKFIERRQLGGLVTLLCEAAAHPQAPGTVGITTALRGAGGFGKTTLAKALCFDERVRAAYPDGILWTTLGEHVTQERRVSHVLDLMRWWSDDDPPMFTAVSAAAAALRERLADRRVLLVVDDVWRHADLVPFLNLGMRTAVLATTRNRDALPGTCRTMDIDAMDTRESIALLGRDLGLSSDNLCLDELAARLGRWPLLLSLAGSRLRDLIYRHGLDVQTALDRVSSQLARKGLTALDEKNAAARSRAVQLTMDVSLDGLSEDERRCYERLAIFPEGIDIPISMLARFWWPESPDADVAESLCERLHDLSLVQHIDLATGTIRLHDVFCQYLIDTCRDALPGLHATWLDVFRPTSDRWYKLPVNEPYAWQFVAYHLRHANRSDELANLLFDFDWMDAKLHKNWLEGASRQAHIGALLSDFELLPEADDAYCEAHFVRDALRLSSHVLVRNPDQLPSQLHGRCGNRRGPLSPHSSRIARLLEHASQTIRYSWFRPIIPSLTPPGGQLLRTFVGHDGPVLSVAITSDGRRVVSASSDRTLKIWDLKQGIDIRTLVNHDGPVLAVAVTPDGQHAVSASTDRTLKLWDLEQGAEIHRLVGHNDWIMAVAITSDGKRAVSGSLDRTLKIWDLERGVQICTLAGHGAGVNAVALTPDDKHAVSASTDQTLKLWDLVRGVEILTLTSHDGPVRAVAVTPNGEHAVSASADRTLKIWDLARGCMIRTLAGHDGPVQAVAVTPDGKRAVSGSLDRALKLWDLEQGSEICTLASHGAEIRAMVVTPDGKRAVSASADRTLKLWDLEPGFEMCTLACHDDWVDSVAVTPDGKRAVSGSLKRTLKLWDIQQGTEIRTFAGHYDRVRAVAVMPDGKCAVSASDDGTLKIWDLEQGSEIRTLAGRGGPVRAVTVTSDGKRAVSASHSGTLELWDLEQGVVIRSLAGHDDWVRNVAITPDSKRVATASNDGTLKLWDLEQGTEIRSLCGHDSMAVAITRDGRRIASASFDGSLKVWDLDTGTVLVTFVGDSSILACAISPLGDLFVAGDSLGRVHFLELIEPDNRPATTEPA